MAILTDKQAWVLRGLSHEQGSDRSEKSAEEQRADDPALCINIQGSPQGLWTPQMNSANANGLSKWA